MECAYTFHHRLETAIRGRGIRCSCLWQCLQRLDLLPCEGSRRPEHGNVHLHHERRPDSFLKGKQATKWFQPNRATPITMNTGVPMRITTGIHTFTARWMSLYGCKASLQPMNTPLLSGRKEVTGNKMACVIYSPKGINTLTQNFNNCSV